MFSTLEISKKSIDSYEKGRLFEEYVIKLFNDQHFKLKDWRKAERIALYDLPKNHCDPDLELLFGRGQYKFAVECKWRNEFKAGIFQWEKKDKSLEIYRKYSRECNIPVFIVIGVGGDPSNPEKMYVTPLECICSSANICESDLMPYKRKPTRKFYYDIVQLKLF
jgi:hypothetical protein